MTTCAGSSLSIRTVTPRQPGNARVPVSVAWMTLCAVSSESALSCRSRIAIVATTAPYGHGDQQAQLCRSAPPLSGIPGQFGRGRAAAEASARATSVHGPGVFALYDHVSFMPASGVSVQGEDAPVVAGVPAAGV